MTRQAPRGPRKQAKVNHYNNKEIVQVKQMIAVIEREGDGYVAPYPDVDIAHEGATVGKAREERIPA